MIFLSSPVHISPSLGFPALLVFDMELCFLFMPFIQARSGQAGHQLKNITSRILGDGGFINGPLVQLPKPSMVASKFLIFMLWPQQECQASQGERVLIRYLLRSVLNPRYL